MVAISFFKSCKIYVFFFIFFSRQSLRVDNQDVYISLYFIGPPYHHTNSIIQQFEKIKKKPLTFFLGKYKKQQRKEVIQLTGRLICFH